MTLDERSKQIADLLDALGEGNPALRGKTEVLKREVDQRGFLRTMYLFPEYLGIHPATPEDAISMLQGLFGAKLRCR